VRSLTKFLIPAAVSASLLVSACGGSSQTASSAASAPSTTASSPSSNGSSGAVVKTGSVSKVSGTVLVNAQGLTLYRLSGERAGKFICTSSGCLQVWHPLTVSAASKPTGSVGSLGVVKRPDGTTQVTYRGMPLYTFAQDTSPGEANGQGIKDVGTWNAVTVGAASSTSSPSSSSSPTSSTSGGSYSY
jgi:predicted lipoprotein with Yx(FWY)xxD motif